MFFIGHNFDSMVYENHFIRYRYDANFLYPTSYELTDTKTETKEEIWLRIMILESKAS